MKKIFYLFVIVLLGTGCSKNKDDRPGSPSAHLNDQPVGAASHNLLSSETYTAVKIQVQYMTGYEPDAGAVAELKSFLDGWLHKPAGIQWLLQPIPDTSKTVLSTDDLAAIEKKYRTVFTTDSTIGVYVLYTNGDYTDKSVLGIAYRNTSLCLFGGTISDHSGGLGQVSRSRLTATVAEHEFGHILGLVDTGSPMQSEHEDGAHGHHCNNKDCLMYYAAETTDILGFLISGNVPALDAACREDLEANY